MLVLEPRGAASAVGVLRWRTPVGDRLTLLVKAAFRRTASGFDSVAPSLCEHDYVPRKARTDVLVDGQPIDVPGIADLHAADFDFGIYQHARVEEVSLAAEELPAVEAVAELCDHTLGSPFRIPMSCDTVWMNGDELALVWRGDVGADELEERDRVVVSLEPLGSARSLDVRLGQRARAKLSFAIERAELGRAASSEGGDELALERLALSDEAPKPELSLQRYANVSAELAEGGEPRAAVLERHGLDEVGWALEERASLEGIAQAATQGDASLAVAYADAFVAAQDALGSPDEQEAMVHEYVAVSAELERADDPMPVLQRWSMTLAQWMRLDRHWTRRAEADDRVKEELHRMLELERERLERKDGV